MAVDIVLSFKNQGAAPTIVFVYRNNRFHEILSSQSRTILNLSFTCSNQINFEKDIVREVNCCKCLKFQSNEPGYT